MKEDLSSFVSHPRRVRGVALSAAAVVVLTGIAGCGDSAGPESGQVRTEDLQELEERLGEMEDRVILLEEEGVAPPPEDIDEMNLADPSLLGKTVTVSAAVSKLLTETDAGTAFRIAGDEGESIAVMSVRPPEGVKVDDTVKVTGTVTAIDRDTFESDFGVPAKELFGDPDAFFQEAKGQVAIKAHELEILDKSGQG